MSATDWSVQDMIGQCRMQARESLDPDYDRFMQAVANALGSLAAKDAEIERLRTRLAVTLDNYLDDGHLPDEVVAGHFDALGMERPRRLQPSEHRNALAEAERRGMEKMRERAAKVAEASDGPKGTYEEWGDDIAREIRALPLGAQENGQ